MPELLTSREGTISRMWSQLGTRWPNPWWPTGNSGYDDCAAAVSWALWGLNGNQPYQTIVSGIIERSGLPFIAGNRGIQRGDLIGFRWSTDVNYDHIEVALNSPDGAGNFQTIGTNAGPGDNMAVRTRNTAYVHNYARPNYPGETPIGSDEEMKLIYNLYTGQLALVGSGCADLGKRADLPSDYEATLAPTYGATIELTETQFVRAREAAIKAGSRGSTAPTGDWSTKADIAALTTIITKGFTSVKTAITGSKNAILKAIKDKK